MAAVPAPGPGPTRPPARGCRHSPLVEEENVDGADGCHDPDDPAHVGGPGAQLPQVQPARARAVVRGVQGSTLGWAQPLTPVAVPPQGIPNL